MRPILHLSIPVRDLDEARTFYVSTLGCQAARARLDFADVWFYGMQITLQHRPDEVPRSAEHTTSHFGVTLDRKEYEAMIERLTNIGVQWVVPETTEDAATPREQTKAKLADPSGNVIEIKTYADVASARSKCRRTASPRTTNRSSETWVRSLTVLACARWPESGAPGGRVTGGMRLDHCDGPTLHLSGNQAGDMGRQAGVRRLISATSGLRCQRTVRHQAESPSAADLNSAAWARFSIGSAPVRAGEAGVPRTNPYSENRKVGRWPKTELVGRVGTPARPGGMDGPWTNCARSASYVITPS